MQKKEEYQNKMLSDIYRKEQILAVSLFFFRKIDDIDFLIIESIIRRRLGFSIGVPAIEKPLHESIDDLSDHICISKREVEGKKPIYVYEAPIARGVARNLEGRTGYFITLGEVFSEEIYRTVEDICRDPLELTLRRLSIDPIISNMSNGVESKNLKPAKRSGLIRTKSYVLTEKGIQNITDEEKLKELMEAMCSHELNGVVNSILIDAKERGYIVKNSIDVTERGRVYLLSKEYEDQIIEIRNRLYDVGCAGGYLEEYLTHIYRNELHGFYSFVSKLSASEYLKYCKEMGYDDTIIEPVSDSKDHGTKVYPKPTTTDDKK